MNAPYVGPFSMDQASQHADGAKAVRALGRTEARDLLEQIGEALEANLWEIELGWDCVVWPAGLDRAVLRALPLKVRTHNSLVRGGFFGGKSALTVLDLLSVGNFGPASLTDLLLCLERFLLQQIETGPVGAGDSHAVTSAGNGSRNHEPTAWDRLGQILEPVLSTGTELGYWEDSTEIFSTEFLELCQAYEIVSEIKAIRLQDLNAEWPNLKSTLRAIVQRLNEVFSDVEKVVVQRRLVADPPWTLKRVGETQGLTRERIRQIQKAVQTRIDSAFGIELRVLVYFLKKRFGPVVTEMDFHLAISAVNVGETIESRGLFSHVLQDHLGYKVAKGVFVSPEGLQLVANLKNRAREIRDEASLINEEELKRELPDSGWVNHWDQILECCGFHRHYGVLALRDSDRVRSKAAMVSIGRTATKKEIADICGLSQTRVSSYLSAFTGVVRAGPDSWGLTEWVDEPYAGIAEEIVKRIEEDGGNTTVYRLLREIPEKFGLSPGSVLSYMHTPRFKVRDGHVSLADVSSISYKALEEVIDGRNEEGEPYWQFRVEARYLTGFSVTGVPPEVARALGCEPDGHIKAQVANLPGCRDLSVNWALTSNSGASIGYLSDSLELLEAKAGETARITILGDRKVSLTKL